ncbi:MAG TPA: SDR family NAD(P)-dependent oxidoreductase [Pseudobdellovibrionaceae bacterium]|nr:SDR family NAD(P)-dependent oxidoreductase [Pseudobdellovibrionaceae bacterium]
MLKEKWVIITGASSGIGWSTAELLAAKGYHLILLARREERLQELKSQIIEKHPDIKIKISQVDLQHREQIDEFIQNEGTLLQKVDVLINNAGLALGVDKIQSARILDWDVMIDTNIKGLLFLTRGVLEYMIHNQRGHIVNIGSVAGRWVYPGGGVYCATKFAVRALTEGLRLDLMGTHLRVTNVEPGMVETEFSEVRLGSKSAADRVYEGMQSLKAQDIAETILWCIERPPHVNIQEVVVFPTDQPAVGYVNRSNTSLEKKS